MRVADIPKEFVEASGVLKRIQEQGFEAYFVGGSVRDALLNQPINDVDIATSAYPEEIKKIFQRTIDVGIEHGTVLVLIEDAKYEITSFRTESTYQDFRRPDKVQFVRSLKEDLKRRDFTINSLAMATDGQVIDLFEGLEDLRRKKIRAVGNPNERFHEDALRMMRGLRFSSQLGFTIEKETHQAIKELHVLLEKISVERISIEFSKLLLGKNRQLALQSFVETDCYRYCPGLAEYKEKLLLFAKLPTKIIGKEMQAWALLLHCLHIPMMEVRTFLKEWKLPNQLITEVQKIMYGLTQRLLGDWELLDVFSLGLTTCLCVEELLFFLNKESKIEYVEQLDSTLAIHSRKELAVTGKDLLSELQRKPGKWLGDLLTQMEQLVVINQLENKKDELLLFAKTRMDEE